jgi:hypothetical protein
MLTEENEKRYWNISLWSIIYYEENVTNMLNEKFGLKKITHFEEE